jgi:3-oxoacyl-[acyl-carrier-protein] synthase-1
MNEAALPTADVVILGAGARSAAGLTALQVTMSARALKMPISETHMIDKDGDRIALVRVGAIGDNVFGHARLAALGGPALTEAALRWVLTRRRRGQEDVRVPLYLALPPADRGGSDAEAPRLLEELELRSGVPIDRERTQIFPRCRGGGMFALEHAVRDLRASAVDAAVVGGIDSYFDPDALERLDRELRLHGLKTENGFIPGEGAAFVLLVERHRTDDLPKQAGVLSVATEDEPRPFGSDEPCIGEGITRAVQRAVRVLAPAERRIGWMLTDVANERHRVDEWG